MEINTHTISPSAGKTSGEMPSPAAEAVGAASPSASQQDRNTAVERIETITLIEDIDVENINQFNQQLESFGVNLRFLLDEATSSSIVKMVDTTTDEVVKQFPSEDALKRIQSIQEYLNSVSQKALHDNNGLTGALFSEII